MAETPNLPELRTDLSLMEGPTLRSGARTSLIYDPVRNSYFRIGDKVVTLLGKWTTIQPVDLLEQMHAGGHEAITLTDIEELRNFLIVNRLVICDGAHDYAGLVKQEEHASPPLWQQVLHKYIFVRIPLFRPERFLQATYKFVAPLFTRAAWVIIGLAALTGFYLVSRQWDVFVTTFLHFLSPEGALFYGLSLLLIMSAHEFGHAYAAHRYGCRTSTIGVALIVLLPILYTDTTDAWKLTDRRKRLVIDVAGIGVELIIATIATLLWVFLPDGAARSAAFFAATSSWILSLLINLNPLMRFDGYYVLSDAINIPNLQSRSFAFGRWQLRELLFGLKEPAPELVKKWQARAFVCFAVATWIYRFFLYLGIALLVHAMFAKILGIILFVVEIAFFIGRPVLNEVKGWVKLRPTIARKKRWRITSVALIALGVFMFVPWRSAVTAPAVLEPSQVANIYPPVSGRIIDIQVKDGDLVKEGQLLYRIDLPDIQHELKLSKIQIKLIEDKLDRRVADMIDRTDSTILIQSLVSAKERASGLERILSDATIRAPHDGIVIDMDRRLGVDQWVNEANLLTKIVNDSTYRVRAYVSEDQVARLNTNADINFISNDALSAKARGKTRSIASAATPILSDPEFIAPSGGRIATRENSKGEAVPEQAIFEVLADLDATPASPRTVPGVVVIKAASQSPAQAIWRRIVGVLLRETDF